MWWETHLKRISSLQIQQVELKSPGEECAFPTCCNPQGQCTCHRKTDKICKLKQSVPSNTNTAGDRQGNQPEKRKRFQQASQCRGLQGLSGRGLGLPCTSLSRPSMGQSWAKRRSLWCPWNNQRSLRRFHGRTAMAVSGEWIRDTTELVTHPEGLQRVGAQQSPGNDWGERSRGKVRNKEQQKLIPTTATAREGQGCLCWTWAWQRGWKVLSLSVSVLVIRFPISNQMFKIKLDSLSSAHSAHSSNWWAISLSLFWPMRFLIPDLPIYSPSHCVEGVSKKLCKCFAPSWGQPITPGQTVKDSLVTSSALIHSSTTSIINRVVVITCPSLEDTKDMNKAPVLPCLSQGATGAIVCWLCATELKLQTRCLKVFLSCKVQDRQCDTLTATPLLCGHLRAKGGGLVHKSHFFLSHSSHQHTGLSSCHQSSTSAPVKQHSQTQSSCSEHKGTVHFDFSWDSCGLLCLQNCSDSTNPILKLH